MRLHIICVGKIRDKRLRGLVGEYADRIQRYGKLEITEVKEGRGSPDAVRNDESQRLLGRAPGGVRICLDERGEQVTSVKLSRRMEKDMLHGRSNWTLFIGGAHGHDDVLKDACDWHWSLSDLTFPHEIVRLMVVEQLYRAFTIQRGEPYHKD